MTVSTETDGLLDSVGVKGLAEENELLMSELNQATTQLVGFVIIVLRFSLLQHRLRALQFPRCLDADGYSPVVHVRRWDVA